MYKPVDGKPRMTESDASKTYADSFILFCADGMDNEMGTVLYVGDNQSELITLLYQLKDIPFCGVLEGVHLERNLGGVVVSG